MKLANCKQCGKLYKKILRDICDVCAAIERHELILIFRYIRENPEKEISLEQINFEMRSISKLSFSRKKRFSAESTPRCGALHESAALEHLHFFKVKML